MNLVRWPFYWLHLNNWITFKGMPVFGYWIGKSALNKFNWPERLRIKRTVFCFSLFRTWKFGKLAIFEKRNYKCSNIRLSACELLIFFGEYTRAFLYNHSTKCAHRTDENVKSGMWLLKRMSIAVNMSWSFTNWTHFKCDPSQFSFVWSLSRLFVSSFHAHKCTEITLETIYVISISVACMCLGQSQNYEFNLSFNFKKLTKGAGQNDPNSSFRRLTG